MAETKSDPKPSQPTTPQTQPPPPPPPSTTTTTAAARPPTHSRKRKHENADTHHRKLRSLVKSLRPHFVEVLRTPDFRNSQAAHEIRKKLKRVMDVYKQMTVELASKEMSKKQPEGQSDRGPEKPLEPPVDIKDSLKADDGKLPESYIVGGSNLGWNFILFPGAGTKAVYYGVTKEARLISRRAKMSESSKSK